MATENPIESFFRLFSPTIKFPGSGDIGSFGYAPNTQWEAPSLYRGSAPIEQAVYSKVASPGTQLGALIDAVLVLAEQYPALSENKAITDLQEMAKCICKTKEDVREDLEKMLRKDLDYLAENDPEALKKLIANYT